jgi:uncharacterized protein (TIGR02246 family)
MSVADEIQELVERETRAWDAQDAEALVALFHPDMDWPTPSRTPRASPAAAARRRS